MVTPETCTAVVTLNKLCDLCILLELYTKKIVIITHASLWYRKPSMQLISQMINKHELCLLSSPAFKSWQQTTTLTSTKLSTVMDPTSGNVCNIQRRLPFNSCTNIHTVKSLWCKNLEVYTMQFILLLVVWNNVTVMCRYSTYVILSVWSLY
jgi:hypothetical protein